MDLKERIEIARNSSGNVNCYGTALFLTGLIDEDVYTEPYKILDNYELTEIKKPEVGCLALFPDYGHMAVVTQTDPILFMDRAGEIGPFRENVSLLQILLDYGSLDSNIIYLGPG